MRTRRPVDRVAADAADSSLADDGDFQQWTDAAGDDGIMAMYAAPAAGAYLADHADELGMFGSTYAQMATSDGSGQTTVTGNPAPD